MIDIFTIMMLLGCSQPTARRRIESIYRQAGITEPPSLKSVPASLFTKYTGITKEDVEWELNKRKEAMG